MKLHLFITNAAEQIKTKMTIGTSILLFRTDKLSRCKLKYNNSVYLEFAYYRKACSVSEEA
jgi:hypothetical protein